MARTARYRCSYDSCTRIPGFNTEGCKKPVISMHHDEEGMVRVNGKRFGHVSCMTISTLNIESGKTTTYCKQHAVDGIVHVFKRGCAHASPKIGAFFNVKGSEKAANGSKMSRKGMVNVCGRCCSYDSCYTGPSFNVEGNKTAMYGKHHAEDCVVNVRNKRCYRYSGGREEGWGVQPNGSADTRCCRPDNNILGSPIVIVRPICEIVACRRYPKWGLAGKQPSDCPDYGRLEHRPHCTITAESAQGKRLSPNHSHGPISRPYFHIKPECVFRKPSKQTRKCCK